MSRDLMVQVINDFGQEIGAQLEVDDEAYCCLAVGDEFQVHLKFNEHFNGIIFYTELGEVPNVGKKEVLRHYVMQNGTIESNNLTFSYDEESKQLGMACLLPVTFTNLDNLKKILEKFIERYQKEHEDMGRFLQGELPKDDIQFVDDSGSTNEAIPTSGIDPQFMRL
ncbi:MAG: type III secretion system chaperone [Puniceicoccales bacterium]|jgi:hypothetical protein|nr:type III secretion system chaperone [Puniceicoccales bacterium]